MQTDRTVMGTDGEPITRDDLPDPRGKWTPKRKARVLAAIKGGLITKQEACERYSATPEEIDAWARGYARLGLRGTRCGYSR